MNDDDEEILGLIDYLAVEWPGGHVTGEGFGLLLDLVNRDVIRVLDLEFIAKAADGTVKGVALGDIEHGGDVDVTMWDGASSGLLDESDLDQVGAVIEPGSLAGILVYENLWSVALMTALDRSSARMVGNGRSVGTVITLQRCALTAGLPHAASVRVSRPDPASR